MVHNNHNPNIPWLPISRVMVLNNCNPNIP